MKKWKALVNGVDLNKVFEAPTKEYAEGAVFAWMYGKTEVVEIKPEEEEQKGG